MSTLEKMFIERNHLSKVSSENKTTSKSTVSKPKKKKGKKVENRIMLNPNSADYSTQLLKANLKKKFGGYDYGLSDW